MIWTFDQVTTTIKEMWLEEKVHMRSLGLKKKSQHVIMKCAMLCQLLLADVLIIFAQLIQVCHQGGLHKVCFCYMSNKSCVLRVPEIPEVPNIYRQKQLPAIDFIGSKHGLQIVIWLSYSKT